MALSTAIEPNYRINKWISTGLRYEVGWLGVGENRSAANILTYTHAEARLARLRSISSISYFHFKLLNADFRAGFGLEYIQTAPRLVRDYSAFGHVLANVDETERYGRFGGTFAVSVDVGRAFLGAKFSKIKISENRSGKFMNFSLGYHILKKQSVWDDTPKAGHIPIFFLEFAMQNSMPISGDAKAGAVGVVLEPKFAIAKRMSVGFRFDLGPAQAKGYDNDNEFKETQFDVFSASVAWRHENRLSELTSMLGTMDYYFPTTGGWYFIGMGFGEYVRDELSGSSGSAFSGGGTDFPAIPTERNLGTMFRFGIKTSLLRFGVNAHFTGKDISNYMGLQVGFEPGFMKGKN